MSLADKYFKDQMETIRTKGFNDQEYKVRAKWADDGAETEKVKKDFDYAWLHHIHQNPHHWQHWVLVNDDGGTYALEMPKEFVYEMICDWWSFSHKTGNLYEIFDWYKAHSKKMLLHESTRKLVEEILDKIKTELDKDEK